jgi:protein-S-isoprenylcysteine O-methyltransferase Ste14
MPSPAPSTSGGLLQRARVPLGFLFGACYLLWARPRAGLLPLGLVVAALGLLVRVWAAGHLQKHRRLCSGGPYRWTRNPLYLGSFLLGLGFCVAAASVWLGVAFAILYPAVYLPVMKREEAELAEAYGDAYRQYRDRVPLFVPWRRPWPDTAEAFHWNQVFRNREYNAIVGFLVVTVFLLWRQWSP